MCFFVSFGQSTTISRLFLCVSINQNVKETILIIKSLETNQENRENHKMTP